ncbi:MAG: thioredoxin-disulfide reductase [Fervidicoccus sp.]
MSLRLQVKKPKEQSTEYEVAIIGSGPASLSCGLYSARYRMKTIIIGDTIGGQLNLTNIVENYLGFPKITATDLISRFKKHVEEYDVEFNLDRVNSIKKEGSYFIIRTVNGKEIKAKSIVLAIGLKRRKLNVPGENEFAGKGVSYCSICDAAFFKDAAAVAIVGGGDSALEGALLLSEYAKKVYLIHRRDQFRGQPILVNAVKSRKNIEIVYNSIVKEIKGDKKVNSVKIKNVVSGEERELQVNGIFIEIGFEPDIELPRSIGIELDENGFIKVNEYMSTNVEGVFAAGDCTNMWKGFRQIITATAQGAVAAYSAYKYLSEKWNKN